MNFLDSVRWLVGTVYDWHRPFWDGLWPGLLAVAAGIPAGMWLNRLGERKQLQVDAAEQRDRLLSALAVVTAALDRNELGFEDCRARLEQPGIPIRLSVHDSAWRAVRREIISTLRLPVLKAHAARHFSEVKDARQLHQTFLELVLRPVMGNANQHTALRNELIKLSKTLIEDGKGLRLEIQTEIDKLKETTIAGH